jgi:HSP20 family protein
LGQFRPHLYDQRVKTQFRDAPEELAEDARRLLSEIEKDVPAASGLSADCHPPLDVVETATSLEVVVDVAGVPPGGLRVAMRHSTLLIVGAKPAASLRLAAHYHVAERSYGRFARVVRLSGAFDARRARAVVGGGQLRVVLPLLEERRGQLMSIPVEPL